MERKDTPFTVETVRCFNCRNRTGLNAARVVGEGLIACSRCAERQETVSGPGGDVDVIG